MALFNNFGEASKSLCRAKETSFSKAAKKINFQNWNLDQTWKRDFRESFKWFFSWNLKLETRNYTAKQRWISFCASWHQAKCPLCLKDNWLPWRRDRNMSWITDATSLTLLHVCSGNSHSVKVTKRVEGWVKAQDNALQKATHRNSYGDGNHSSVHCASRIPHRDWCKWVKIVKVDNLPLFLIFKGAKKRIEKEVADTEPSQWATLEMPWVKWITPKSKGHLLPNLHIVTKMSIKQLDSEETKSWL